MIEDIGAEDLRARLRTRAGGLEIIDVRSPAEYEALHIRGSTLIPMNELPGRMGEIDWEKEVVFVCRSGKRSQLVARMVSAGGEDVSNLRFGIFECLKDGKGEFLAGAKWDERKRG